MGVRWYAGSEYGDRYSWVGGHLGVGEFGTPRVWERSIGDLVDPGRSGSWMEVVNAVSRGMGMDVSDWGVDRILSMVRGLDSGGGEAGS